MASGIDIGDAWINVVPSFKGIGKEISKEIGGLDSAISSSSRSWGSTISSTLGSAFKSVGAIAGIGLAAATGFIASYTGEALAASDATDKFKSTLDFAGLDSSAIKELTASTQEYADKTVYELSDIQQITAQLASNGVAGFDRLAEAAGNLNAVAGGNKETFKSVGQVITQTAGAGKLMTENWRQLTDAIPGAAGPLKQALADAGAYTGDFSKAMADGEISAEEFNAAIMSLGFQEAAIEAATSTKTFEGAWGNFEAAITGGLVKIIEPLKGPATEALSAFADRASAMFDKAASVVAGAMEIFTRGEFNPDTWFEGIGEDSPLIDFLFDLKENASQVVAGLAPILGGLGGALGPLLSGIPGLGGAFTGLTGPVGMVIGLFVGMIQNSQALQAAFGTAFGVLGQVLAAAAPVIGQIMTVVGQLMGQLGDALAPVIVMIATSVGNLLSGVLPMLPPLIAGIGVVIGALMPIISRIVAIVAENLMTMIPMLVPIIGQVIGVIMQVISAIAPLIVQIGAVLIPIIEALMPVVQAVFSTVMNVVSAAMTVVSGIIQTVTAVIAGDWQGAWEGIKQVFSGVWDAIKAVVMGAIDIVKSYIDYGMTFIKTIWGAAWNWVSSWASNVWASVTSAVSNGVESMMSFIRGIPGSIQGFFANAGSWLLDAGRNIIEGFVNGIRNAFGWVRDTLGELTSLLPDWKGPEDLDKVILRDAGQLVIGGFVSGMESQYNEARKSLNKFTGNLAPSMGYGVRGMPSSYGTDDGFVNRRLYFVVDGREFSAYVTDVQAEALSPASRSRARELMGV